MEGRLMSSKARSVSPSGSSGNQPVRNKTERRADLTYPGHSEGEPGICNLCSRKCASAAERNAALAAGAAGSRSRRQKEEASGA